MSRATPFLVGLLFGLGLCLSGMTNPAKVLGFLDLAGAWDPSLAFVMGGAVVVAFVAFRVALGAAETLSGEPLDLPTSKAIDGRLIGGSLLFGVGWGLVGLCPGPAIADIGFLDGRAALFVVAMAAGMAIFSALPSIRAPAPEGGARGWLTAGGLKRPRFRRRTCAERVASSRQALPESAERRRFSARRQAALIVSDARKRRTVGCYRNRAFLASAMRRSTSSVRSGPRGGAWNTASSAGSASAKIWLSRASPSRAARQRFWTADRLSIGQIPAPSSKVSLRACACVTLLPGGTSRVSQTLPPIDEPRPIVTRPRMVAPA